MGESEHIGRDMDRHFEMRRVFRKCWKGKGAVVNIQTTKASGTVEVLLHSFLASALDGGNRLNSRPGRFNPGNEHRYTEKEAW